MARVKVGINEYAINQPQAVREWLALVDKLIINSGCRVASSVVSNKKRTDGKFTYTSKRTKKTVCIINIGTSGCYISMRGNHFIHPNGKGNILDELPKDMFDFVIKGAGCEPGRGCLNADYSAKQGTYKGNNPCMHGVAEVFDYKGQRSFRCPHYGWNFDLNETMNFEMLTKWISLEVGW